MKRSAFTTIALLLSLWLSLAPRNAGAESCEKSPCRSGDKYDVKQGRCESGPNFWGYRSHYPADCAAGYDFDPARGVCVKRGECCEKSACKKQYKWDAKDRRCESDPTFLNYRSHYTPECDPGWDLDAKTGLCKKLGCGISAPPVVAHPADSTAGDRPDLTVQSFGLLSWGSCSPGNVIMTFQVTVANTGTARSPEVLVQAKDHDGTNWGNGAMVGAIEPGRSRTVTISVAYLRAAPDHMTAAAPHPFKAIVDPLNRVEESSERNNESAVINIGAPRGCS
jgi:hypothetical protein